MSEQLKQIDKLEVLTKDLPSIDYILSKNLTVVEYPTIVGTCYGFPLYRNSAVSIQRMFFSKGTVFPEHNHEDSTEYYVVYKGALEYHNHTEQYKQVIHPGDYIRTSSKQNHSLTALEDTEIVVVKVPPDAKESEI